MNDQDFTNLMSRFDDLTELKGNFTEEQFTQICKRLENNKTIISLNLYENSTSNKGATEIATMLQTNTTLTSLILWNNRLGTEEVKTIAKALQANTTLTSLNLGFNYIGGSGATEIAAMLQTNTTLTSLILWGGAIEDAGAIKIAKALQTNTTLTSFDLSNNDISDTGATEIAKTLKTNTTLTSLNLSDNGISDTGATEIAAMLQTNTTLTSFDLSNNKISDTGATEIAKTLKTNATLTSLNLSNDEISDTVAIETVETLKNNKNLTFCKISSGDSNHFETLVERNKQNTVKVLDNLLVEERPTENTLKMMSVRMGALKHFATEDKKYHSLDIDKIYNDARKGAYSKGISSALEIGNAIREPFMLHLNDRELITIAQSEELKNYLSQLKQSYGKSQDEIKNNELDPFSKNIFTNEDPNQQLNSLFRFIQRAGEIDKAADALDKFFQNAYQLIPEHNHMGILNKIKQFKPEYTEIIETLQNNIRDRLLNDISEVVKNHFIEVINQKYDESKHSTKALQEDKAVERFRNALSGNNKAAFDKIIDKSHGKAKELNVIRHTKIGETAGFLDKVKLFFRKLFMAIATTFGPSYEKRAEVIAKNCTKDVVEKFIKTKSEDKGERIKQTRTEAGNNLHNPPLSPRYATKITGKEI